MEVILLLGTLFAYASAIPTGTLGKTAKELVDVSNLCLEPECVHAASSLLQKMDLDQDPCEDFYEFACGKFVSDTAIPDDQVTVNTFNTLRDSLKENLRTVLEKPSTENEISLFKSTKSLYKTCLNKTAIESLDAKPMLNLIKTLGGWPALEKDWNGEKFSVFELLKKFRMNGVVVDYLFDFSVATDFTNSTRRRMELDQPEHFLAREYLVKGRNNSNVETFVEYFKDLMVLLGANPEVAQKDASDVINFAIGLAQITSPKEERRNASLLNNPMTLKELQKKYSWNDWHGYLSTLLPPYISVSDDDIVNIRDLKFFDKLGGLLADTQARTLANFLFGRMTVGKVKYMSSRFRKRQLQYLATSFGKTEEEPRTKECVELVVSKLPNAVSALYVREFFNKNSRKVALEMVDDISSEFASNLNTLDWMDSKTREEANKKLKAMETLIGYPEELENDAFLAEYYKDLEVIENQYLESSLKLQMFLSELSYKQLRDPVVKDDWKKWAKAAQVNAFYNKAHNHIRFPAGILQGHFFNADRPKYLNYAAIGAVIGHEITHGFDDTGRQFDADGNLRDWWQPETSEAFSAQAKCIVDAYSQTLDPQTNLTLNGIITQGENIADMGGIQNAYVAYKRYVERNGNEKQLPGLQQFSSNQLFWVATSQNWCSKVKDEALKLQITRSAHPPGKYRVLLPLKHNKAFANDFGCAVNSPMNPEKKCKLW